MKSLVLQLRKLDIPFLDVRLPIEYAKSRLENSCNIPFAQVSTTRAFELPPRHVPFAVVHTSDQRTSVLQFFSSRHTPWSVVAFLCADLPNLSYHHSHLFTVSDFADLTAASEETDATKQDDPSSIFIPGTGKRYRRQKTESGVSASESADSIAPSDTPGVSEPCTGTCGATCDGTICMSLKQLNFIPLSTVPAKPADMSQEEGQSLWDLCSAAGVPVKGEDTAPHSITLFHPCAPLVRFIAAIERALLDRASDNPAGPSADAASSLAPALRSKEEYTTAASTAASAAASPVAPSVATVSAGAVTSSSTVLLDCIDIGCGHARDSLWLVKRHAGEDASPSIATTEAASSASPTGLLRPLWRVRAVDEVAGILSTVVETARVHGVADRLLVTRTKLVEQSVKKPNKGQTKDKSNVRDSQRAQQSNEQAMQESSSVEPAATSTPASARPATATATLLYNHKPLPGGDVCAWEQQQHDLVVCVRFLVPALLPQLDKLVRVGGFVVYQHFYEGCTHPANVLHQGQLQEALGANWEVWCDEVEILGDGRPVNNFVARKMKNK